MMTKTCEGCAKCVREWPHVAGGPFDYIIDVELRDELTTRYGLCVDQPDEPIVVLLRGMGPCEGTCWTEES